MKKSSSIFSVIGVATMLLASCTTDYNAPGVEYMPDMYRSPALEAYVDYGTNEAIDLTEERKTEMGFVRQLSRNPPKGTIPYTGSVQNAIYVMPYSLTNTPEDYELAGTNVKSPLTSTKEHIEAGKNLYMIMCKHCHGETGKGDGTISKNGFITGIPDYAVKLKELPEGKMFHTITHGKGLMGPHSSLLNQKERWQVIEWVKLLQKGIPEPTYDANDILIVPIASPATVAPVDKAKVTG
ncbi:MAG: cytochrome c [Flavobacteriales bacterium]|nr:cytochrome c [Flavobacteriales bacterium]